MSQQPIKPVSAQDEQQVIEQMTGHFRDIITLLGEDVNREGLVKTPERAASIARVADAVVAGSVLVDEVAAALEANEPVAPRVLARVKALADAVRGARVAETV